VLRDLGLFALVVLVLLGPVEAFLAFRLRQATHRGHRHYLASADPWVTVVVALAGVGAMALVRALS
jgi:hypothetical protein